MDTEAILERNKKYAKNFLDYAEKHKTTVQKLIDAKIVVQVHHVISVNSVKHFPALCKQTLMATAYNINHMNNLAAFPSNLRDACYLESQIHRGGHPDIYYKTVADLVAKKLEKYDKKNCEEDAQLRTDIVRFMDEISKDVLGKINARTKPKSDEEKDDPYQLTKRDIYKHFCAEGVGCLGLKNDAKFEALRTAQKSGAKKCDKKAHKSEYPSVKFTYIATIGGK